jgi:hypothetical protein
MPECLFLQKKKRKNKIFSMRYIDKRSFPLEKRGAN